MRFNRENCDTDSKVFAITKAVAQKYLECLNNKSVFDMKMKKLIVYPFELPIYTTYGQTHNNQMKNELIIVYNESGSSKFLAFVIAHEMAHILMYPHGDKLVFCTNKRIRYTVDGKDCFRENTWFDTETEEALASYLAYYITSKMDYDDAGGAMEEFLHREETLQQRAMITQMEAAYGKPLMECEKIDEYCSQENEIVISNSLWYSCVTHFLDPEKCRIIK